MISVVVAKFEMLQTQTDGMAVSLVGRFDLAGPPRAGGVERCIIISSSASASGFHWTGLRPKCSCDHLQDLVLCWDFILVST